MTKQKLQRIGKPAMYITLGLLLGAGINRDNTSLPREQETLASTHYGFNQYAGQEHINTFEQLWDNPACLDSRDMALVGAPFELRVDSAGNGYLTYIGPDMW